MILIGGAITLLIFLVFAVSLDSNWVQRFDQWGVKMFEGNSFVEAFHYIGEPIFVVIIAIIILLILWFKSKNTRAMIFVLLTIAGGNVVNLIAKKIIQRDRPDIPDQLTSYSFPSGHSMTGLLYLFTIAYLVSAFRTQGQKALAYTIAIGLTVCIGLSRVAGSRHYLSDVISGWSLGFTVFALVVCWYELKKRSFNQI